jgi:hypothetical protein
MIPQAFFSGRLDTREIGWNCSAFAPVFLYRCGVFEFLKSVAQLIP